MKHCSFGWILILALCGLLQAPPLPAAWAPAAGNIMTRWAKDVKPDKVLPEYPRPQLVRKRWQNLNGLWDYAIAPKSADRPTSYPGQILVPFAVQSALSGVKKTVGPEERLWYRRSFQVPADWAGGRVLLHFGAVDWQATVWVNGHSVGEHSGGFDAFTLDVTKALRPGADQEIMIAVWDPTNQGPQPRGKQVLKPSGIYYTAVTGIWQTVWLEPVPAASIAGLKITPDLDQGTVRVRVAAEGAAATDRIALRVLNERRKVVAQGEVKPGDEVAIKIDNPTPWSPERPFLYGLQAELLHGKTSLDRVDSYFGLRKISIQPDEKGINRLCLNGKPLFQFGPLDQGWWPDGLYTAPTDVALRFDIEQTLRMGFNMARKHVKVEPDRWYYWADKLGLLVWQDMPSGDKGIRNNQPDLTRTKESAEIYEREYKALIEGRFNHPSIIMWVPFNEGWGQFDTERITKWTRQLDPTRLVNNTSGWTDRGVGDVSDMHKYPGPGMPPVEPKRAAVLGEFGGLGLAMKDHLWVIDRVWGYRDMADVADLTKRYDGLVEALKAFIAHGLAAAVYTQTTDCEGEVNGLLTYDRAVNKIGLVPISKINRQVYGVKTDLSVPIPQVDERRPAPKAKGKGKKKAE